MNRFGKKLKTMIPAMLVAATVATTPVQAKPHIEFYDEESISAEVLTTRKQDQALVVERVAGKVLSSAKNGRTLCGKSISYKNVAGAKKNDLIVTYNFYNPDNNYLNGINCRMHYINSLPDVKLVNYATKNMRTHRKNNYLLIERVVGEVKTSDKKGRDTAGRVIDYRKVPGAQVGDVIVSYRVYTNSNKTTDVARRYDFIWR